MTKKNISESIEDWIIRAKNEELSLALKNLKNGEDIESVIEKMSSRLTNKALHPLIEEVRQDFLNQYKSNDK